MNFRVYALYSRKSDIIYVGISENIKRRVQEHNSGRVRSTKANLPFLLFFLNLLEPPKMQEKWKSIINHQQEKEN